MRRRFLLVSLVGFSACGFSAAGSETPPDPIDGSGSAVLDASPRDGAPADVPIAPIDTPPDAAPVWTTIETVTIPCRGQLQTTTTVFNAGEMYRLRASGMCIANNFNNSAADAEYLGWNLPSGQPEDESDNDDVGIAVNKVGNGPTKSPRWGTYTTTHIYEVMFAGLGATAAMQFQGGDLTNNSGTLSVAIQRLL